MELPVMTDTGGGERLTILRSIGAGLTARLEGEAEVEPGKGPPMHVHFLQSEGFRVVAGRLGYQLQGSEPQYAGVGEEVTFPAGVGHRFWNAGEELLRLEAWVAPAGNFIWFITRLHEATLRNGGSRPGFFDGAFLLRHFSSEYDLLDVPAPLKRFVFPVAVVVGRLLGLYRRYADAPEPLRAEPLPAVRGAARPGSRSGRPGGVSVA